MIKKLLLLFCLPLSILKFANAQQDITLYYMNNVPQINYTNASFTPRSGINLGLPLISSNYISASNSGFSLNNAFYVRSDDSLGIRDLSTVLRKKNFLTANAQVDIFSFGIKGEKNYFAFYVTEKFNSKLIYPKGLFQLMWEGNGKSLLGNRASFDGLGIDFTHHREYAFTFARELTEKLDVGARLKYLNGLENISTKRSKMGLTTDISTFDLITDGGIDVRSSGVNQLTQDNFDFSSYKLLRQNHGLGIDVGANYKYDEKISFSGALNDLGFIKWKDDIKNYKDDDFSFTYSGFGFNEFLNSEDTTGTNAMDAMLDSVTNTFKGTEYYDSYTSYLTSRILLGGSYQINKSNSAGVLFQTEINKGVIRPALALSYSTRYKNFVSASLSYSILNRSFANLGAGFSINMWPLQIYVISDNILAPLSYQGAKNAHVRFGINLTFLRPKEDRDKDGIKDNKDECPDEAGLPQYKGCPDTDGDGIINKNDSCPDVAGSAELKGCPDKDNDGIADSEDACPDEAGSIETNGCPDKDGDSIIDKEDECPDDKGLVDLKGCPDSDDDKVADKDDECPETPGTIENNGCPEVKLHLIMEDGTIVKTAIKNKNGVFVFDELPTDQNFFFKLEGEADNVNEIKIMVGNETKNALRFKEGFFKFENIDSDKNSLNLMEEEDILIKLAKEEEEILKRIFNNLEFDFGSDIIMQQSFPYLEELAELMIKHKKWRIKLAGHTDNIGSPEANMILSQKRVEAVKKALIVLGIENNRVLLRWHGQSMPISSNDSEEGRQKNRRVEMKIIE